MQIRSDQSLASDLLKLFENKYLKLRNINELTQGAVFQLVEDPDFPLTERVKKTGLSVEDLAAALKREFSNQISNSKHHAVQSVHGDKHYDLINPLLRLELNGIENIKLRTAHEGIEISEIPGFLTITIDPSKFNDTKKLFFTGEFKGEKVEFVISPKGNLQPLRGTFDQSNTATITLPAYIELPDKEIPLLEKPSGSTTLKVTKDQNTREIKFQSNTRSENSIATNDCMITVNGRPTMSHFILEPAPVAPSKSTWEAVLRFLRLK